MKKPKKIKVVGKEAKRIEVTGKAQPRLDHAKIGMILGACCPSCGNEQPERLAECPSCASLKCNKCDMGDDVECPSCEMDQ